ncbi:hypothetical protein DF121_30730 [Burkholderia stagnalis]|nr:hypothetical protein DF145_32715 [Burkholderia stagnalis]RQX89616.1 hypothetical protein DF121_30730 [Burkholderia stagnalis]RQY07994.1 hypothetical protein DF115_32565 [Burkholderia stagnalis]RQY23460.1 hypothetical protein DF114_32585 [Burkholderia stagnalis]
MRRIDAHMAPTVDRVVAVLRPPPTICRQPKRPLVDGQPCAAPKLLQRPAAERCSSERGPFFGAESGCLHAHIPALSGISVNACGRSNRARSWSSCFAHRPSN